MIPWRREEMTVAVAPSHPLARTMLAEIQRGRLVSMPLDAPDRVRPVGIVHRKRKKFNGRRKVFWSCCWRVRRV